jgi:hypothetical protein
VSIRLMGWTAAGILYLGCGGGDRPASDATAGAGGATRGPILTGAGATFPHPL